MTLKHNSQTTRSRLLTQRSLLLGLGCIASLGLLGGGLVRADEAQAPIDNIGTAADLMPPEASSGPPAENHWAPEPAAPPPEPIFLHPEDAQTAAPEPDVAPAHESEIPAAAEPTPDHWEPEPVAAPPEPSFQPDTAAASSAPSPEAANVEAPHNYIDPTEYSVGATNSYEAPTTVIFSERSTGCEAALQSGQGVPGTFCGPPPELAQESDGSTWHPNGMGLTESGGKDWSPIGQVAASKGQNFYGTSDDSNPGYSNGDGYHNASYSGDSGSGYGGTAAVAPIDVGPITITSISSSGLDYYNRTSRPTKMLGNGDTQLLFPLSIPSAITSVFGWRQHPLLGYSRFHTGIDFGADLGTPVVAAYSGQVAIADWLGGYGITVVLQHAAKSKETLYGHMSELFVKPGQWVEQGEVIGRVGSTGMSTGPHLHFEMRQLTPEGWVVIDPGNQVEYAMAQLLTALKMKAPPLPKVKPEELVKLAKATDGRPQLLPLPPGLEITITHIEPPPLNFAKPKTTKPE